MLSFLNERYGCLNQEESLQSWEGEVCVWLGGGGGGSPSLRPGIVEMFQRLSPSVRQVCEITSVFLKFV